MRQAVAALVIARAVAHPKEQMSSSPALPDESPTVRATRRRRTLWWAWLPSVWKATHAGG